MSMPRISWRGGHGRTRSAVVITLTGVLALLGAMVGTGSAAAQSDRTYVIATDVTFAPFEFQNEQGDFVGIDMDLLAAIAEDQGFDYQVKPLGFNAAVQALQSRQVDGVIAGMSITDERKLVFDFSDPYFESGVQMAVSKDNDDITSYEDLRGQRVAVKTGTEGAAFADSIKNQYGFTTVTFDDSASMYDDVKTGNSVAVFDDYPVLLYGIAQGNGLKTVTEKEAGASYGFAVSKGQNAELLSMFNAGLANVKASGQYDQIIDTYLGEGAQTAQGGNTFFSLLRDSFPLLMEGLWLTIVLTVVSLAIAVVLGLIFGFFRVSTSRILRGIGVTYVDIFRGTPLIVQAFFIYFGIPAALDFKMPAITAGIITLSLNAGAYITEIIRGGILSVDKGQMEAARSLGMGYLPAMRKVVLPQAFRTMMPSFVNQTVITLKDTSILSVIGIAELTQTGKIIIARNFESFNMWLIVGIFYFVIIMALTKLSDRLEKRINQ